MLPDTQSYELRAVEGRDANWPQAANGIFSKSVMSSIQTTNLAQTSSRNELLGTPSQLVETQIAGGPNQSFGRAVQSSNQGPSAQRNAQQDLYRYSHHQQSSEEPYSNS